MDTNINVTDVSCKHADSEDTQVETIRVQFNPKMKIVLEKEQTFTLHLVVGNSVDKDGNRTMHIIEGNFCPGVRI